jgi:hypothetical protein
MLNSLVRQLVITVDGGQASESQHKAATNVRQSSSPSVTHAKSLARTTPKKTVNVELINAALPLNNDGRFEDV